jgi:DNA-binding transcriptional regulator YdaS (Cro superfamily)
MGWLDSIWGRRSDDPLQDFDPKVREFLKRESPVKYDKKPSQHGQNPVAQQALAAAATPAERAASNEPAPNAVPRESLYPDGRYAHLWKTYRPLGEIESETKSDHEKLQDVLDAFKSRKAAIGAAALENCAEEQLDWNNCMKSGSMRARMTMCRDEVRKFERCYNMQSVS